MMGKKLTFDEASLAEGVKIGKEFSHDKIATLTKQLAEAEEKKIIFKDARDLYFRSLRVTQKTLAECKSDLADKTAELETLNEFSSQVVTELRATTTAQAKEIEDLETGLKKN